MKIERLASLDAFRGFTIAAMILVNYPGTWSHIYAPLKHAEWNGLTPTDLIFPFFLFVVGTSIALAYTKRIQQGADKKSMVKKIVWRTIKIFAVGIALNYIHHFDLSQIRIAGVLQRISVVFLVCSILFIFSKWQTQVWVASALLVLYWITMVYIPTPGIGAVSLEPGVNIAAWVDSYLLPGKMWQGTWDPEGVYSTLPAIATGIIGMLVGKLLITELSSEHKIIWLFVAGTILSIVGYFWSLSFPVNKNLWTSSFVLVTAGFACILLAASYFFVDVLKRDKLARIGIVFGANAITVYVLAALFAFIFYSLPITGKSLNVHFVNLFMPAAPKLGSLLYALMFVGLNYIPAYILYRKKIFIKL